MRNKLIEIENIELYEDAKLIAKSQLSTISKVIEKLLEDYVEKNKERIK